MKRKIIAVFVLLCIAASLLVPAGGTQAAKFPDVDGSAGYAEAVHWAAEHGYINGYPDGRFGVDDPVTRAQLAAVLYRAAGNPAGLAAHPFPDVRAVDYYADAAIWAAAQGYIRGYADGRFGGSDPVTRQQLAVILWRQAGSPEVSGTDYTDERSIAAYARAAVDWSRVNSIVAGRADGRFDPNGSATRAEVVSALYQYKNLDGQDTSPAGGPRILVAYFSATGSTAAVAGYLSDALDAELYEITAERPYTAADLDYTDPNSRSSREQNDPAARPEISGTVEQMEQYDVVFLGYPIWHGQAPKIISTFLEGYEFSSKTIVPFCTSHSSGLGSSADNLHALASDAHWLEGNRFSSSADASAVEAWASGLELPEGKGEETKMPDVRIEAGGQVFTATLADNPTARALLERLPLTAAMKELNGNEKYYNLPAPLPVDAQVTGTIHAGDLMLYGTDCLVLFYESFTSGYQYTPIGRVDDPTGLAAALGSGDVEVVFSPVR